MIVVFGGGNLSTDSPVRRQKRFQSTLRKFQRFTGSLWAGTFSLGDAIWERVDLVTEVTFLEYVCEAVHCPGRNSRRPWPRWCWRSIGGRRNWLLLLGHTAVQGCWMLPSNPGSHSQGMFCCSPSWHVGSWSRQHSDWGVGTSGWPWVWVASVDVYRRFNDLIPATSSHKHSVSDCSGDWSTSDHSNRSWSSVAKPCFLPRTDTVSEKLGITGLSAVVQWISCMTMMHSLFSQASCSITLILFLCCNIIKKSTFAVASFLPFYNWFIWYAMFQKIGMLNFIINLIY